MTELELVARLVEVLPRGSDNAVDVRHLCDHLHLARGRTGELVRGLVRVAIDLGCPVGSNTKGYFIIDSEEEWLENDERLSSRMAGLRSRRAALLRAWR